MSETTNSQQPGRPNALMPRTQAPLTTLGIAMTVMCYLACLAIGGLLLINRAVSGWTSEIAGEVTVQIQPVKGADTEAAVNKAVAILKATQGVNDVRALSRQEGAELLEPWLGKSRIIDELPLPRLIAVTIDHAAPPDFEALEKQLASEVPGATLDTHRRWQAELTAMAGTLRWLAIAVLALIAGSTIALVIYASHAALEANREVVEVLYLVGAKDRFIARQVEWRFLFAGLRAGLIGAAGGIGTFALISLTSWLGSPSGLSEAGRSLLFGPPETTYGNYLVFLSVPVLATLISLATARSAVFRILKTLF